MSTDLVLHSTQEAFSLAELICKSPLVPQAYRGKPVDAAVAMLYGAEIGFPPMTSLQRIVVINGKPSCDAQGMVSLIRQAGHSINGDVTPQGATVTGKRGDNGDVMTATFTAEDAQTAGLLRNDTYKKYAEDMYWARAVSRLARRLFADVLLSVSYVPEEADSIPVNGNGGNGSSNGHGVDSTPAPRAVPGERKVRQPPGTASVAEATTTEDGDTIVEAEVVDDDTEPSTFIPANPGKKATVQQLNKIRAALNRNLGIREDEAVLAKVSELVKHPVTDLLDLTESEAIDALTELAVAA